jgi:hypothetical protein
MTYRLTLPADARGWLTNLFLVVRTRNNDWIWGKPPGSLFLSCYSWKVGYDDRLVRSLKIDVEVENTNEIPLGYVYAAEDWTFLVPAVPSP